MSRYLAVDGGGTSTRGVVVDEGGGCLGYGVAASGNPISAGPALAARSIADTAAAALGQAHSDGADVELVLLAIAGVSTLSSPEPFAAALAPLGVRAPIVFVPDLLATFCSGTWQPAGYALVAGTGAAALRVEGGRVAALADGLGWLLGDDGSGFWIGRCVVRAAVAELDRRGPRTALTPALLDALGIADDRALDGGRPAVLQRLIDALYAQRPVELAQYARLAFAAAGDEVADAIVRAAADALGRTLDAVADPSVSGPIVLGGGTLAGHRELGARLAATRTRDGEPPEVRVVADGTVGAAVLALRAASVAVDEPVFSAVTRTLAALR